MRDIIGQTHLYFAREGAVIDGVTVASDAKPDTDPASNYTKVASCEGFQQRFQPNVIERWSPTLGTMELREEYFTRAQMSYVFDLQEWSELTLAELSAGSEEPSSGVYVPGARRTPVKGWWIIQIYDQRDLLIDAKNVWGSATVEPYTFGENLRAYRLTVRQLQSPLNTGEITNLS